MGVPSAKNDNDCVRLQTSDTFVLVLTLTDCDVIPRALSLINIRCSFVFCYFLGGSPACFGPCYAFSLYNPVQKFSSFGGRMVSMGFLSRFPHQMHLYAGSVSFFFLFSSQCASRLCFI
jgi:hypothetical protein